MPEQQPGMRPSLDSFDSEDSALQECISSVGFLARHDLPSLFVDEDPVYNEWPSTVYCRVDQQYRGNSNGNGGWSALIDGSTNTSLPATSAGVHRT